MKTHLVCNNCNEANPIYSLNCDKCNSFLRAKIPNIDLWDTIWNLLISPIDTFVKIIQADKKNFLGFIFSIWFIKASINQFIIYNYKENANANAFVTGGIISIILIFLFSLLTFYVFTLLKLNVRWKDIIATYAYTFIPILLAFVFLTPFHLALYGFYWYTINPPPLVIKPFVTFVLYGVELIFYLWTLFLLACANYAISGKKVLSFIIAVLACTLIFGYHFLI